MATDRLLPKENPVNEVELAGVVDVVAPKMVAPDVEAVLEAGLPNENTGADELTGVEPNANGVVDDAVDVATGLVVTGAPNPNRGVTLVVADVELLDPNLHAAATEVSAF